jgi:hypothetical protein
VAKFGISVDPVGSCPVAVLRWLLFLRAVFATAEWPDRRAEGRRGRQDGELGHVSWRLGRVDCGQRCDRRPHLVEAVPAVATV